MDETKNTPWPLLPFVWLWNFVAAIVTGRGRCAITWMLSRRRAFRPRSPRTARGPAREFKAGAILLSQLSGKPMLPIAFAAHRVFRFPTWDEFILPLPFTRAVLAVGEPAVAPKRMDAEALAEWQRKMQAGLTGLYRQARDVLLDPGRAGL